MTYDDIVVPADGIDITPVFEGRGQRQPRFTGPVIVRHMDD